jgi:hypothetical protein
MKAEIAQFKANHLRLSQHKRLSTGQALEPPKWTAWPQDVNSDETFRKLVSEAYKLWREQWGADVGFLLKTGRSATRADSFGRLVNQLRTAHQHATDDTAIQALEQWLRHVCGSHAPATPQDWTKCGSELMNLLTSAVDELADVAAWVTRNPSASTNWHQRAGESVHATVVLVADDLGLRFTDRGIGYHKRQVDSRWRNKHIRPGQDPSSVLMSLVEQQLISRVDDLPCSYQEVLEELNLFGSPSALSALQLAHAIATISRTQGEDFIKLVVTTWTALQPPPPLPRSRARYRG